jgi:hypothetical protein
MKFTVNCADPPWPDASVRFAGVATADSRQVFPVRFAVLTLSTVTPSGPWLATPW